MQALPSGHLVSELPPSFPCAQCNQTIMRDGIDGTGPSRTAGYAVRANDREMICYDCATANELQSASETGKLFAYVKGITYTTQGNYHREPRAHREYNAQIVSWPGHPFSVGLIHITGAYRSNFGDVRITLTASLPTGPQATLQTWHGTYFASAGDYVRLTRNKHQTPKGN